MTWRYKLLPLSQRRRMRVRDIAMLLNVAPDIVIEIAREWGEFVASPQSFLEEPVLRRLSEHFRQPILSETAIKKVRPWERRGSGSRVGPPPTRKPRRDVTWEQPPEDDLWAAAYDASPTFEIESWKLFGFSETDRDLWIDAGLRPGQVNAAAKFAEAGFRPSDLALVVSGWTVRDRLRKGEEPAEVLRLLKRAL